jgi:hypothetical protein
MTEETRRAIQLLDMTDDAYRAVGLKMPRWAYAKHLERIWERNEKDVDARRGSDDSRRA